jgi:hypothetical protein
LELNITGVYPASSEFLDMVETQMESITGASSITTGGLQGGIGK